MKTCSLCNQSKNKSAFYARDARCRECMTKWRKENRPTIMAYQKRWKQRNLVQHRSWAFNWHLKRKFGIDLEDWARMFNSQNGRCCVCETRLAFDKSTHVDHCHATGKVRGLLCIQCNALLGYSRESLTVLQGAISYLRGHLAPANS